MKKIALLALLLSSASCKCLDFGGKDEKAWELQFFWDRAPAIGKEDPKNPGFDTDGNKIPSPEIYATYYFPDIHAGFAGEIKPKARMTPVVGVELLEFKIPYARWFNLQVQGGADIVSIYLGKRFTSIIEVTVGPWVGRDFELDDWAYGLGGTLIKF